jgi:mannosyltransferase
MATAPVRPRVLPRLSPGRVLGSGLVRAVVGVGLLMALSAYLRTRSFGSAFWIDEGLSWGISSHHFFSIPHVLRQDGSPPLYYMALHVWMALFGTSEKATHGLSLLFALLTIPVAFWAGRSLFSERAGWFAAVLFALNTYLTTYAQETRMYSLMVLLTLLATAGFFHAFVFRRRRYLWLFGGATVLMLYTHNWGAFFVAASLAALAVLVWRSPIADRRSLLRDAALGYGGAFLLFIPWIPTLLFQAKHTGAPWATVPSFGTFMKATSSTLDGDRIAFLLLLGGGAGLARMIERRRGVEREAAITGLVLFAGTLLIAWLWSQASPAWAYRYFAVFVAPLLLIAGVGLAYARRLGMVALAIVVALWVPFTAIKHKSINRHVERVAAPALRPGDLVLVTHPEQVPVVNYYMAPGMKYATELGPVKDTGVADWIDALDRLQAATTRKDLLPLLDQLKVGQHVLLMRPIIGPVSGWKAPWTKLVRVRSAQWARAMSHDREFKLVARYPRLRHGYAPRGMRALLYTKVANRP